LTADYLYNGGFYWEVTNRFREGGYGVLNLSSSYELPGGHWTIGAYATNVTNKYYSTAFPIFPTAIGVVDAPPRMYGLSVRWKL
jgi:outer membrane receptor protein involved in Fe transport